MMIQEKLKLSWASVITWAILVFVLIFTIAPLAFTLTSSFMTRAQILRMPYSWIPEGFHFDNYVKAIKGNDGQWMFARNLLNSLIVSLTVAATTV